MEGVGKHIQFVSILRESVLCLDLFLLSAYVVGHGPSDGDLEDLAYGVVGHKVHGHENHGHQDAVHGDGVRGDGVHGDDVYGVGVHEYDDHEDGVHGIGAHWNYDYEGVHVCHWCENGGDDILKEAAVKELLLEVVVCLSDFCRPEEVGIQVYVAYGDGGYPWIYCV